MNQLEILTNRLKKINISVEFVGNIPWIYLVKVNGNTVKETYLGEHGFTAFWYPVMKDKPIVITNIKEIFKIIRKYK